MNVPEGHPGADTPQPRMIDEKMRNARSQEPPPFRLRGRRRRHRRHGAPRVRHAPQLDVHHRPLRHHCVPGTLVEQTGAARGGAACRRRRPSTLAYECRADDTRTDADDGVCGYRALRCRSRGPARFLASRTTGRSDDHAVRTFPLPAERTARRADRRDHSGILRCRCLRRVACPSVSRINRSSSHGGASEQRGARIPAPGALVL